MRTETKFFDADWREVEDGPLASYLEEKTYDEKENLVASATFLRGVGAATMTSVATSSGIVVAKFNPAHVPGGSPAGGQFAEGGEAGSASVHDELFSKFGKNTEGKEFGPGQKESIAAILQDTPKLVRDQIRYIEPINARQKALGAAATWARASGTIRLGASGVVPRDTLVHEVGHAAQNVAYSVSPKISGQNLWGNYADAFRNSGIGAKGKNRISWYDLKTNNAGEGFAESWAHYARHGKLPAGFHPQLRDAFVACWEAVHAKG